MRRTLLTGIATWGLLALAQPARAAGEELVLQCENGRSVPFKVRAVSVAGELVTGYLLILPRQSVHVRLVPMGTGYRYAGPGIWLDGTRENATLNVKGQSVACTVS